MRLTVIVMKMIKPTFPTTQIRLMMTKAETALSADRKIIDSTVAESHLSLINYNLIVNQRLKNTHLALITLIDNYMMITY